MRLYMRLLYEIRIRDANDLSYRSIHEWAFSFEEALAKASWQLAESEEIITVIKDYVATAKVMK